jgi:ATP-dependent DNA ligase
MPWVSERVTTLKVRECPYTFFEHVYGWLKQQIPTLPNIAVHEQEQLHWKTDYAFERIEQALDKIKKEGGEGVMIRHHSSVWNPNRSHYLLKIKPISDAEGIVVGYTWGRETDLGSKLLGKMGAMILRLENGKEFELSGFTDEERVMSLISDGTRNWMDMHDHAYRIGCIHPGEKVQDNIENPKFPRGTVVTFQYRELSDTGIPKEGRYWRKHV